MNLKPTTVYEPCEEKATGDGIAIVFCENEDIPITKRENVYVLTEQDLIKIMKYCGNFNSAFSESSSDVDSFVKMKMQHIKDGLPFC